MRPPAAIALSHSGLSRTASGAALRPFAHRYRNALRHGVARLRRPIPFVLPRQSLRDCAFALRHDVPKRTRTSDLQVRNLTLYPTELWAQNGTEREGFEPSVPERVQLLSREPDSATLAPLHFCNVAFALRPLAHRLRRCAAAFRALLPQCAEARCPPPFGFGFPPRFRDNCFAIALSRYGTERVGFEPTEPEKGSTVFKTASFDHSDISPTVFRRTRPYYRDEGAVCQRGCSSRSRKEAGIRANESLPTGRISIGLFLPGTRREYRHLFQIPTARLLIRAQIELRKDRKEVIEHVRLNRLMADPLRLFRKAVNLERHTIGAG